MQDRFEPDAILQARYSMPRESWNEMLVLCYPNKPFQFNRSLARALILVRPEVSVVSEDEKAMVVYLPFIGQEGLVAISNAVGQTPEGRIAEILSDAYRFSLPSLGLFFGQIHSLDHIASKPNEYEWMTESARRFAWRAVRRYWEDMVDEGGGNEAEMHREISRMIHGDDALSYEGYLATLKQKIEEVLPQIEGAVG